MTPITPEQVSALEHSLQMLDCGSKEVHRSTLTCVNDPESCAVCERDELSAELTGEQTLIRELQDEAKRFYLVDGSYEECESAEACVEKRKAAAKLIAELERDRLSWCDAVSILDENNAAPDVHDHLDKIERLCCNAAELDRLRAIVEPLESLRRNEGASVTTILKDKRPIRSAWSTGTDDEAMGAIVGVHGVTRIEPYVENGQMAPMTWLKVWKGDVLAARLNTALMVEITYAEEPADA